MSAQVHETPRHKISIRIANNQAYVWDIEDIARLRTEHRLLGMLAGTLPQLAQQNVFLGVPLLLMPEEVVLLLENSSCVLVDDPRSYFAWKERDLENWADNKAKEWRRQIESTNVKKQTESNHRAFSAEALRKRAEREAKKARTPLSLDDVASSSSVDKSSEVKEVVIHIPSASTGQPGYSPDTRTYETISSAKASGVWTYPSNIHEHARCGVFRDLWEQGYFIGTGIKFGGDYVVYPGDLLRYHSHFVATVFESHGAPILPMEIVAHGRLGTATKKSHLLCSWDNEKKETSYMTIEWSGFG